MPLPRERRPMKHNRNPVVFALPLLVAATMFIPFVSPAAEAEASPARPRKFRRVWTFADARDEDFVRKMAAINVQNVGAKTPEQFALAEKYGLMPYLLPTYVGLAPGGWHRQMISEAETTAFQVLVGIEPPPSTLSAEERAAWRRNDRTYSPLV